MLDFCGENRELSWLHAVVVALSCTGLRISELASLRWSDIDSVSNQITLTDESTSGRKIANRRGTKSGRSRSLPLHGDFATMLQSLPKHDDGLIFHGPLGGKLKPDTVRNILIREVIEPLKARFPSPVEGPGFPDGRLHSFRHYFCSIRATSGIPERVVMDWLRHSDSKMAKHYFHLHDQEAQRQMKRRDLLGGAPGGVAWHSESGES